MYSCTDFLRGFSDYRDGEAEPGARMLADAHLAGCESCSRYVEVVDRGIRQLRALPPVEPSDDFLDRLQHQLYRVDEERAAARNRVGFNASGGLVVGVMTLVSISMLLSFANSRPTVVVLPPVMASAPEAGIPLLFREGPFLRDDRSMAPRQLWTSRVVHNANWSGAPRR
ncbi:MAG: zf-HC2 domain-containing protein [Gemmatimonadota bacterium]|jgi:anti-sigma factor RsiW|nr:zf-HC2 domain-containing protein [Gemmatimonadota bacterium]